MVVTLRGVTYTPPEESTFFLSSMAPPKRRIGALSGALIGVAALALVGATFVVARIATRPAGPKPAAAGAPPTTARLEASGNVTLKTGQFSWDSRDQTWCQGTKGYDDIRPGAQVTVTDAAGKALAIGTLDAGQVWGVSTNPATGFMQATLCTLHFKVVDIPSGVGPYGFEVSHRGIVRFEEANLNLIQLSLAT